MTSNEWFKDWFDSPFYHKLYFDRDEEEAGRFIHKLTSHLAIEQGSRILDAACGKGRHAFILADMGFDVTGIDLSPASIAFAKQFEKDNLHYFIHDMRLPFWGNYFDYAFNFFTSFGYFRTRREHDDVLRTISRGLKPGGTLVIDYLNVHFAEDHLNPHEIREIEGTKYEIHRSHNETHFIKKIIITDPSLKEPLEFTEVVAKFSFGDFTDMLSFQGMQVSEVFGDYELSAYDVRKTPRMIIVAGKTKTDEGDKEKRIYSDGRATDPF